MPKSSGGGGSGGRSGGGAGSGERQPGDSDVTAYLRANYANAPVRVSVEQMRGGVTRLTHALGEALVDQPNQKVTVITDRGKRYTYNNVVKGVNMWESLAGFKT